MKSKTKEQQDLGIKEVKKVTTVEGYEFEPIRGQPMLRWAGKRPFTSTQYFPAQEKERHGDGLSGAGGICGGVRSSRWRRRG